jgi:CHRD domain-containing protein
VLDIGAAVAAHIHTGDAKVAGPVLVTLRTPNTSGVSSGCVTVPRTRVAQILANRGRYYVNVHTAEFPGGAIRGQLGSTEGVRFFIAELLGSNEIPPADANGRGTLAFRFDSGTTEVCFTLSARGIALPAVAAHIHRGAAGANGPVIVTVTPPDANGSSRGCVESTAAIVAEILGNPAGFYANVHTPQFPGGAIRGQLSA